MMFQLLDLSTLNALKLDDGRTASSLDRNLLARELRKMGVPSIDDSLGKQDQLLKLKDFLEMRASSERDRERYNYPNEIAKACKGEAGK
jgi:hypothetical protein